MDVLIIVVIIVALIVGLFSVFLLGRDFVLELKEKRGKKVETVEKVEKIDDEKETAETCAAALSDGDGKVAFSTATLTLDEKYSQLSNEYKGYYDEIVRCAMAIESSKRYKNNDCEVYKVGKNLVVKLKIKRGVVVCELVVPNLAFKTYLSGNKVSARQAPTTIRVVDEVTLAAVKDGVAIATAAIAEEKAYKKEQAKLRRKKQREEIRDAAKSGE